MRLRNHPLSAVHDAAAVHPAAFFVIDQQGYAGDGPGNGVGKAEGKQGSEPGENGKDPDDAKQGDTHADDNDRNHSVTNTAQHRAEHLHQHPGKIEWHEV